MLTDRIEVFGRQNLEEKGLFYSKEKVLHRTITNMNKQSPILINLQNRCSFQNSFYSLQETWFNK